MKILERGQLTIPKKYRDRYGIRQNTELDILPTENGLLIIKKKMKQNPFREVFGILGKQENTDSIIEEMRGRYL